MSQTHNDNIQRPVPQETHIGIFKIYAFCQKIQQRHSGAGESTAGVTYNVFKNKRKKLVVQGRVQLQHSSHIVKVGAEAIC